LDPDIELVGTAANGREALDKIPVLKPDVVVLDVEMPVLDGLSTLRRLMKTHPVPVVMLSSYTRVGSREALEALSLGAVDFVPKPENSAKLSFVVGELAAKVKTASRVSMKRFASLTDAKATNEKPRHLVLRAKPLPSGPRRELVVIGCSTGGPAALQKLIPQLPADLPAGVVVVQHMPVGFTASLAEHLARYSVIPIKHAADGDRVLPGKVLIAPSGADLYFVRQSGHLSVKITGSKERSAPGVFHPSVDGVMISAARLCGSKVLGVLLTGMGRDGALGMQEIKKQNGMTIAEAEESCVVFGMPKAAIEIGAADKVVPIQDMAREIVNDL
ncbi:MAG: chemotaxis response regulator protein-glutamate methylesterase, partial [Firmicutes bacterium]|nr:chemotaxis response regulator protein-glutamate methylesterase [Bacillota bacterium]